MHARAPLLVRSEYTHEPVWHSYASVVYRTACGTGTAQLTKRPIEISHGGAHRLLATTAVACSCLARACLHAKALRQTALCACTRGRAGRGHYRRAVDRRAEANQRSSRSPLGRASESGACSLQRRAVRHKFGVAARCRCTLTSEKHGCRSVRLYAACAVPHAVVHGMPWAVHGGGVHTSRAHFGYSAVPPRGAHALEALRARACSTHNRSATAAAANHQSAVQGRTFFG